MTDRDNPPTEQELARIRDALKRHFGMDDHEIEKTLRKQEDARQERVLASHGPWGGER